MHRPRRGPAAASAQAGQPPVGGVEDGPGHGVVLARGPDHRGPGKHLFVGGDGHHDGGRGHGTLAQARIQNDVELLRDFKEVAWDVLGVKHVPATSS